MYCLSYLWSRSLGTCWTVLSRPVLELGMGCMHVLPALWRSEVGGSGAMKWVQSQPRRHENLSQKYKNKRTRASKLTQQIKSPATKA